MRAVVSMVKCALATQPRDVDPESILRAIKTGKWEKPIREIRHLYRVTLLKIGKDQKAAKLAVDLLKKNLPGLLWSGRFARRANDALIEHSGLLCVDVDSLGAKLRDVREKLLTSPHLFALFLSPTGDGLKAIFRVPADASKHLGSFRAVSRHVLDITGVQVDQACKDVARLCFVSNDPQAYFNPNAREIEPLAEAVNPKSGLIRKSAEPDGRPDKAQIREMLAVIPKRPNYADWIRIVAAVGDALSDEDAIELLKEWSPEERDGEYADKLRHRLENVHIGTLIHLAKQHGWAPREASLASNNNAESRDELTPLTSLGAVDFPKPLLPAAFHGLAGDFVRRVLPHTEADEAALLIQFLDVFGNVIGRTAHAIVDGASHYCNENVVLVGRTSKSRKGTGLKHVKNLFKYVDPTWSKDCITPGLSTGEGLIWSVRDPIWETKPVKENGQFTGKYETVQVDPGVSDKRLMVIEEEFSKVLVVADRKDNTLSAILRSAWDGDDVLRSMTKNSPARATDAHISIIGHITREELRSKLTEAAAANGFGNRFLLPAVNRSKVLPEGGGSYGVADLVGHLKKAIAFARKTGELKRDEAARKLWAKVYPKLSAGKPGLLGAITARAEAHVLRLSDLYALLDCSALVRVEHLLAALAVWKYCEDSARWIFETKTGNKQADRVLAALKVAGEKGLTKWEITSDVFSRNATRFEIDEALRVLHSQRLAFRKEEKTSTKPAERWFYREKPYEEYEESCPGNSEAGDTSYSSCVQPSRNASASGSDTERHPMPVGILEL